MYHGPPLILSGPAAGTGVVALTRTGLDAGYYLVAAATLVLLGLALLRLIPRRES